MNPKHIFPRPLQYLIAVSEHGSFTRAAEALYVSQPTLSQQIKQLEDSLNLPLLDRSGKTVRLTDAGETYVFHARRAWSELEAGTRAVQDVQNLSRGSLRIGWTPITDFLTCSLLDQFNRKYPGISLSTLEMPADGIETAVHNDLIDFGIVFSKPIAVDQSKAYDIKSCVLFEEKLCLAVGNSHPRSKQKERISAKELDRENMIMLNSDFVLRRKIDSYCIDNKISPNIAMETDSLSVIIEMVQAGTLATILPESIISSQCGLYSIIAAPRLPDQIITVICRNKGYKSPACVAFSELAMEWSKKRHQQTPHRKQRPCPLSEPGDSQSKFYKHLPKSIELDN
jgi:LysR family transcriptional regulator, cyn operon transcriptional activator